MKAFNSYTLITAPVEQPVSLAEVKAHCYIDITDDDTLLTNLIEVSTLHVESILRRKLITQTWRVTDDDFFCDEVELPLGNLQTISIKYYDTDGNLQTLTDDVDFISDKEAQTGKVRLKSGKSWPSVADKDEVFNAVRYEITVGYGLASDVPLTIKQAILLIVGHLYENREQSTTLALKQLPLGVDALLANYILYGW